MMQFRQFIGFVINSHHVLNSFRKPRKHAWRDFPPKRATSPEVLPNGLWADERAVILRSQGGSVGHS